jgi:predicted permease
VFRQFLAESALLAAMGALLSVAVAHLLSRGLVWALSTEFGGPELVLDTNWRVLAFTAGIAAATCIVFGLAPAMRVSRTNPTDVMRGGGRTMTEGGRLAPQKIVVVVQVAVSLVLLVAALLFVRSFRNLITFDPGLRLDGVAVMYLGYGDSEPHDNPDRLIQVQRQLVDEIRAIPGVVNAATTSNVPLFGGSWTHGVEIDGAKFSSKFTWVGAGYLDTMGVRVIEGRGLLLQDTRASARVAVVNEAFARKLGGGSPIGKRMRTGAEPRYPATTYEIVGVIPDTQYNDLKSATPPMAFAPDSQHPALGPWCAVMFHAATDPSAAVETIKQHFAKTHPQIAVGSMIFKNRIRDGMLRERLLAGLAGFFGVLAGVLAMVGLYGMVAYAVAQRRQEIGIRVALGASRVDVVAMMMRDASRLVAIGVLVGAVLALLAGPLAATLLFGLAPRDPVTIAGSMLLLFAVAIAASFVPARAAARLDPLQAIREN